SRLELVPGDHRPRIDPRDVPLDAEVLEPLPQELRVLPQLLLGLGAARRAPHGRLEQRHRRGLGPRAPVGAPPHPPPPPAARPPAAARSVVGRARSSLRARGRAAGTGGEAASSVSTAMAGAGGAGRGSAIAGAGGATDVATAAARTAGRRSRPRRKSAAKR